MLDDKKQNPEIYFISLASQGVEFPLEVSDNVIDDIVTDLRQHIPRIYFPFYWKSIDVKRLIPVLSKISHYDLKRTLFKIKVLIANRYPLKLHWMESINIFHLMGILRMMARSDDKLKVQIEQFINKEFLGDSYKKSQYTIIDISSLTSMSVAKQLELKDAMSLVKVFITNPNLFKYYGYYQMHYYGGVNSIIEKMEEYLATDDPYQIVLPQTLIGLASIHIDEYPWYGNIDALNELFTKLPKKLKKDITPTFYEFLKNGN